MVKVIHGQLRIDRLLIGPACLLCFARVIYVASQHLALAPQYGAKYQFLSTV